MYISSPVVRTKEKLAFIFAKNDILKITLLTSVWQVSTSMWQQDFDLTARCGCSTRLWIVMSPLKSVFGNNKSANVGRLMWNYSNVFICKSLTQVPLTARSLVPLEPPNTGLYFFSSGTFSSVECRKREERNKQKWANESRRWLLRPECRHDWRMIIIRYRGSRQHFDEVSGYKIHTQSVFQKETAPWRRESDVI